MEILVPQKVTFHVSPQCQIKYPPLNYLDHFLPPQNLLHRAAAVFTAPFFFTALKNRSSSECGRCLLLCDSGKELGIRLKKEKKFDTFLITKMPTRQNTSILNVSPDVSRQFSDPPCFNHLMRLCDGKMVVQPVSESDW